MARVSRTLVAIGLGGFAVALLSACATFPKRYVVEDGVIFEDGDSSYGVGHEIDLTGRMPLDFIQTVQNKSPEDVIFERIVVGVGDRRGHLLFRRDFMINRRVAPGETFTARHSIVFDWAQGDIYHVRLQTRAKGKPERAGSCGPVRPDADAFRTPDNLLSGWASPACDRIDRELDRPPRVNVPRTESSLPGLSRTQLPTVDDRESYAVYQTVLDPEMEYRETDAWPRHVLIEETAANECFPIRAVLPKPWNEAAEDFNQRNLTPARIVATRLGRLWETWTVAPYGNVKWLIGDNEPEWAAYRRHYQSRPAYTRLSHVGFDQTRTHAIVYTEHICPGMCSGGRTVFLEKDGREWSEVNVMDEGLPVGCLWEV
jgi:hypothetical protein